MSKAKAELKGQVKDFLAGLAFITLFTLGAGALVMWVLDNLNEEVSAHIPAAGYVGSVWVVIALFLSGAIWNANKD